MAKDELDYFIKRFKSKVFNLHSPRQYPFSNDFVEYRHLIYIENTLPWQEDEIKEFAGVCLDFSHLADAKIFRKKDYQNNLKVLKKFPIGCNHISALGDEKRKWQAKGKDEFYFSRHFFRSLKEFDYLKEFPLSYFSDYLAIEIENCLADQLKVIDYIAQNIGKK